MKSGWIRGPIFAEREVGKFLAKVLAQGIFLIDVGAELWRRSGSRCNGAALWRAKDVDSFFAVLPFPSFSLSVAFAASAYSAKRPLTFKSQSCISKAFPYRVNPVLCEAIKYLPGAVKARPKLSTESFKKRISGARPASDSLWPRSACRFRAMSLLRYRIDLRKMDARACMWT